jgi:hypothetical protein
MLNRIDARRGRNQQGNEAQPEGNEQQPDQQAEDAQQIQPVDGEVAQQPAQQAPAPREIAPRDREIALERIANRREAIQRRMRTLPEANSGRFTQSEAQILNGYVERVRSQVADPRLGFGNRSARELANNFDRSGHAAQFRTPDNARASIIEIGRRGVQLENAQQRVDLIESQTRAVRNLRDEISFARDRGNVNRLANNLRGVTAELTADQLANRRTSDEWDRVIDHERGLLQDAVRTNRITQQEMEDYLSLRQLQRDSLSSTDRDGNIRRERDLVNPNSLPAYRRLNNMSDDGRGLAGGMLFNRIQTDIIGSEDQIRISAQDLRALRRSVRDSGYDITWRDENGENQREDLDMQGAGARRVTPGYQSAHLETMLNRVVSMLDGVEDQVNQQGYGLDDNTVYRVGVRTPDVALTELGTAHDYLANTALPAAEVRLGQERQKFDDLAGDLELTADPNVRAQLEQELAELNNRERELNGEAANGQEAAAANPELDALRQENEALRAQLAEQDQSAQRRRQFWTKIGTFVAGAVVGVAAVAVLPAATVGGLIVAAGVTSLGSAFGRIGLNWGANRIQNNPNATERDQRLAAGFRRLSNALLYVSLFTFGFGVGAGVGSVVKGWLSPDATAGGLGSDSGVGSKGGELSGAERAIPTGGAETVAVPGDSQWSMIDKTLRAAFPNASSDQIANATGNILQQAGPEKVYEVMFAHRTPDIVGGAVQIGDKLSMADLTQIAPDIVNSLKGSAPFIPVT